MERNKWTAFVGLAVGTLALACFRPTETPGVPLYPNGETTRLPPSEVAQVAGPIGTIDGRDVAGQGGVFDLLPGCHIVELERRMVADSYALTGGTYWTGEFPPTTYAIRMKPGARYVIRREIYSEGGSGRLLLSAREEQPGVAATDLYPAKSGADIDACKQ